MRAHHLVLPAILAIPFFSSHANAYVGDPFTEGLSCEISAISHQFAPAHHTYTLFGECHQNDGTWGIKIDVEWFGKDKRVHERILIGKYGGELWATCPADPVIDDGECSDVSYSGIYDVNSTPHVSPVLQSRRYVSDLQKSQIRDVLADAFPAPSIDHPLNNYIYSDPFREAPGEYEIPIFVTMPYAADVVVTVKKLGVHGFEVPEPIQRHHEIANHLSSEALGGGQIYAYRDAYSLPGGKYRLDAWAQEGTYWRSDSRYVIFVIADKESMQQELKNSGRKTAQRPDTDVSQQIKKDAATRTAKKPPAATDKFRTRKPAVGGKPVSGNPPSAKVLSVLNPTEGTRYQIAPWLKLLVPNRTDIIYRINECELAGSSNCNQYEFTISGSKLSCEDNNRNCAYAAPFDDVRFVPNAAYTLIINTTPYQGYDAIMISFEVGRIAEDIGRKVVPGEPGPIPKDRVKKTLRDAPEVGSAPPPPRDRHSIAASDFALTSGGGPTGMEEPPVPEKPELNKKQVQTPIREAVEREPAAERDEEAKSKGSLIKKGSTRAFNPQPEPPAHQPKTIDPGDDGNPTAIDPGEIGKPSGMGSNVFTKGKEKMGLVIEETPEPNIQSNAVGKGQEKMGLIIEDSPAPTIKSHADNPLLGQQGTAENINSLRDKKIRRPHPASHKVECMGIQFRPDQSGTVYIKNISPSRYPVPIPRGTQIEASFYAPNSNPLLSSYAGVGTYALTYDLPPGHTTAISFPPISPIGVEISGNYSTNECKASIIEVSE